MRQAKSLVPRNHLVVPLPPILPPDVEALNLIEEVLHHYLEAVEASRSPLLNIDLYNDNAM